MENYRVDNDKLRENRHQDIKKYPKFYLKFTYLGTSLSILKENSSSVKELPFCKPQLPPELKYVHFNNESKKQLSDVVTRLFKVCSSPFIATQSFESGPVRMNKHTLTPSDCYL